MRRAAKPAKKPVALGVERRYRATIEVALISFKILL